AGGVQALDEVVGAEQAVPLLVEPALDRLLQVLRVLTGPLLEQLLADAGGGAADQAAARPAEPVGAGGGECGRHSGFDGGVELLAGGLAGVSGAAAERPEQVADDQPGGQAEH